MAADFGFSISLQVRHPHASTEKLSKALRLVPGRAWVAREPRTTPTGVPLPGVYRNSCCYYDFAVGKGGGVLEEQLRAVTRRLGRHARLLASWRRSGGTFSYYVTIYGATAMGGCSTRSCSPTWRGWASRSVSKRSPPGNTRAGLRRRTGQAGEPVRFGSTHRR